MKKIRSFSLWGDNPTYTQGSIRNAEFFEHIPFPSKIEPKRFVGQVFNDKDELLHPEHSNLI